VCGGRDFQDRQSVERALHALWTHCVDTEFMVVAGDARGADEFALDWAGQRAEQDVKHAEFVANWSQHPRAAGPIRNQRMIDEGKPDLVLAFPGGRGTEDMCRRARKAGIEVRRML